MLKFDCHHMDFHVTSRCNLSCLRCNRLTHLPQEQYPFERLVEDAGIMARYMQVGRLLMLGGEPLVYPRLGDLLDALRFVGLAKELVVVSNGVLSGSMPDSLLRKMDTYHISRYPKVLHQGAVDAVKARCASLGVRFEEHPVHTFFVTHSAEPTDPVATYGVCQMWHCREYREGYLTRCGTAVGINRVHGDQWRDSLRVDRSPEFADQVQRFFETKEPLAACGNCYGSARPEAWREERDPAKFKALNELPP